MDNKCTECGELWSNNEGTHACKIETLLEIIDDLRVKLVAAKSEPGLEIERLWRVVAEAIKIAEWRAIRDDDVRSETIFTEDVSWMRDKAEKEFAAEREAHAQTKNRSSKS